MQDVKTPPASRRELRRQDRREAILTVAAQYFLEHGYAGTTMSAIAATLGGSKGTLWNHFASKEELFAAVMDHVTIAYRARLSEILDPSGDLGETLRRFCTGIMMKIMSAEAVALHRLVMAEAGRFPEMGAIFYDRAPLRTHKLLGEFLSGATDRGQIRPGTEPTELARTLISLCMSGAHQKVMMGLLDRASHAMIATDVDRAVDIFLRAYAPDPEPGR